MPEYRAPGVYVEEGAAGPRPIEGVSTSTAGFVGETERGPTRPRLVTSWQEYGRWFGGYIDRLPAPSRANFYLPYAVRGFFDNGGQRLYVARVIGAAAATAAVELPGSPGPTTIRANGPGDWGNLVRVVVGPASAALTADPASPVAQWFRIQVLYCRDGFTNPLVPETVEDFDDLSGDSTRTNFAQTVVNDGSRLITIVTCPGPVDGVSWPGLPLENGSYAAAAQADYLDADTADPELRKGLAGLGVIRDISLMAIPDEVVIHQLAGDVQDACDGGRDRFAIHAELADEPDINQVQPLRDSSYGALYYPWVRVAAPHTPNGWALVPPQGHAAGIYARVDLERGVHKAPANEVVRGLIGRDLAGGFEPLSHTLSKAEQDILNPRGVNVIRDFRVDGRDIRLWGARTMSSDSLWKYVNVRRLFIFLEQSIGRGTQWAVFEPNSEPTWIAMRQSITNFLRTVWRNGALMGTTEDEAFFVRCDRTSMTQDDIDNGRLVCLIGIAPVKPAEFVIFRISQMTLEAEG
jgi:phage tail sheath protein FI